MSFCRKGVFLKLNLSNKITAVTLTAAILFISVFSMSILASAATSFSPRLSAPASSNKYYYSDINVFYKYGYGMPNCTAYAYGRAYEILKKEPKLSWGNAEDWYGYNKSNGYYSCGKTPKLGAIACWSYDGGGGHVAVVEKIENGKITFSNSAWSGQNFYLSGADVSDPNAGGSSWWNFQGYIYIGDFTGEETTSAPEYKTGVYKTNVDDSLNMRSGAGTSYNAVASIGSGIQLNVTDINGDWGYTSYKGKNGWVCLEYCIFVSELPAPTTQPATAKPTEAPTIQPTTVKPTVTPTTDPSSTSPQGLGVGDVNCDGYITITDATLIQKYLADQANLTDKQVSYCDFDFDGRVSIMDSTCLQKYLASNY